MVKPLLFEHVTRHRSLDFYLDFDATYYLYLQGFCRSSWTEWSLNMGLTCLSRNVGIQLPTYADSVPEDRQPQLRQAYA